MRAVNLLPRDVELESTPGKRAPVLVAACGAAVVVVLSGVLMLSASGTVADRRSQLDSVEAAIAHDGAQQQPEQPSLAPAIVAEERSNRVAALSAAMSTRIPIDRLLREVSYVLPEDVWLTGFTAAVPAGVATTGASTPPAQAPSPGADGVTIKGATRSYASIARLLARLSAVPSLERVRLTESGRNDLEADDSAGASKPKATRKAKVVITFTITAALRSGVGA